MHLSFTSLSIVLGTTLAPQVATASEPICKPFKDIYTDGTDLCETLFDTAFKVVDDSQPGYTMWFFDTDKNPNDLVTSDLGYGDVPEVCDAQWFHKDAPSPESDDMRECHPWKQNSCCHAKNVASVETLKLLYGQSGAWDNCGPMSQACERFFVQEDCFYECDPHIGLFRKWDDANSTHEDFNTWQIEGMPIKQSYCDAWFDACQNDYYCARGDFLECNEFFLAIYPPASESDDKKSLKVGLGVVGGLAGIALLAMLFLIHKEKKGEPIFSEAKLQEENEMS